ncbi:MAG: hypothetical protein QOI26_1604, partial [Pseudonocardiales bacterium]|nr:hypothetical protein [Pseudonocardiales bacterium]
MRPAARDPPLEHAALWPAPCGEHSVSYPDVLVEAALRGEFYAFATACGCPDRAYLVHTASDSAHAKAEGPATDIVRVLRSEAGVATQVTGPWRCSLWRGLGHGLCRLGAMPVKEWRAQLRGAVYRGDGRAIVALTRTGLRPDDRGGAAALQLIGDGLISALAGQAQGAAELAADCVSALSERGWNGDTELVEHLQALLGT